MGMFGVMARSINPWLDSSKLCRLQYSGGKTLLLYRYSGRCFYMWHRHCIFPVDFRKWSIDYRPDTCIRHLLCHKNEAVVYSLYADSIHHSNHRGSEFQRQSAYCSHVSSMGAINWADSVVSFPSSVKIGVSRIDLIAFTMDRHLETVWRCSKPYAA